MTIPNQPATTPFTTCYRHPDRRAGVACQRCNRPICPSCMTAASVGFHCPECLRAGAQAAPVYSTRNLPGQQAYVTVTLIAINILVFVGQMVTRDTADAATSVLALEGGVTEQGILWGPYVGINHEWWRLISGGFLHANLIHIGMNMFVLYLIGPQLERLLGAARYLALYLAALVAGSLGVMIVSPQSATLGASGAIFGLLGAMAAYQLSHHIDIMKSGLGRLIGINLVITFLGSSFISVGGHVGGLIGGAAAGYAMFVLEERKLPAWAGIAMGAALAASFAIAAIVIAPTHAVGY
jgi:membrane associated rhomboid family serine protease